MFCFVSRLSNRSYEDFIELLRDGEVIANNDKNEIYKWCYNFIAKNDKGTSTKERQEKVKKEIKEWIIKNTLINYK